MQHRTRLDDVREFTSLPPKYFSAWGRADCVYNWIGTVVRFKSRLRNMGAGYHRYGLVIEVGRGRWLAALWNDGTDPGEHIAVTDAERWWPPSIYQLKIDMLARKRSEEELADLLHSLEFSDLTPDF